MGVIEAYEQLARDLKAEQEYSNSVEQELSDMREMQGAAVASGREQQRELE